MIAVGSIVTIVALGIAQFSGAFNDTVPVTVMADRAGLVMNPGAKVKWNGAQIGTVSAIDDASGGQAQLRLAIDRDRMGILPDNVLVEIGSSTVFGAKSVELLAPKEPSTSHLRPGQVLDSRHVTVEVNTLFEELNSVLTQIDPAKLNETLGAMSTAFGGRGEAFGQSLSDFNAFLGKVEPSLPQLSHELETFPAVATAYADAAPDILAILRNTGRISQTLVDEQSNLDRFLVSSIGLADIGNDVVGGNADSLTKVMHLLVPTTDLTNEYHEALNCALTGATAFALKPPGPCRGSMTSVR